MTPYEELLELGKLGDAGAELLYKTIWSVAAGHGFPAPTGTTWKEASTVEEAAHDFLTHHRTPKRFADITVSATDERSFARLLYAAVLNYFRDCGRATDLGKVILRVKAILKEDETFVSAPGSEARWTLSGAPSSPSPMTEQELAALTVDVTVVVPKWTSERRDAPLADGESFRRLLTAMLSASGGSVSAEDLARAVTLRLDHRRVPLATEVDLEQVVAPIQAISGDPGVIAPAQLHAQAIFDRLSDRERILLTLPDTPVRELGTVINMGKTQAGLVRQRLFDNLKSELSDDDDLDTTTSVLCRLCDDWVQARTHASDTTSDI